VTLKYAKNAFAAGAPLVGPIPLGACRASTLALSALASRRPPHWFFDKSNTAFDVIIFIHTKNSVE